MKRILLSVIGIFIIGSVFSQVVNESTIRKFNIGVGMYADLWQGQPPEMKTRAINQGAQVFGMYNYRVKEGIVYLAGGIGLGFHNNYSDAIINDVKADSISFMQIPDDISYKKSKIGVAYIDVPLEFRIKTEKGFRIAFGFKFGFLISSTAKYKGNRINIADDGTVSTDGVNVKVKSLDIKQLESWRYGPTFRIGYKWFNVTAYYQISKMFKVDRGPEMYPISIGIAVIPF